MKKIQVFEETWADELGEKRQVTYYLLVEELAIGGFFCENYGVALEDSLGGNAQITGITTQRSRIEDLLFLLYRHKVSPVALGDVVADLL